MAAGKAKIGSLAPDFTAKAVMPDGQFKDLKLSDYRGKSLCLSCKQQLRQRKSANTFIFYLSCFTLPTGKYVVFFFYPLDFTFVCPTEIIAFSDAADDFRKIGCEVIAASVDSHFSHFAWYFQIFNIIPCASTFANSWNQFFFLFWFERTNTPRKQGGLGSMKIPLVSDTRRTISTDYGVLKEDEGIAYRWHNRVFFIFFYLHIPKWDLKVDLNLQFFFFSSWF